VSYDDPPIGGNPIAGVEQHDIAGHHRRRGDLGGVAVATDGGRLDEHRPQGREARFGPTLLDEPQDGVEHEHDGDDDGVLQLADHPGEHGGPEQHQHEQVAELVEQRCERGTGRSAGQLVRTVEGEPFSGLGGRQATGELGQAVVHDCSDARDGDRRSPPPRGRLHRAGAVVTME
jgi:hypothetical protein